MTEPYNKTALHFDKNKIPSILTQFLQPGFHTLADLGCGDGPWFNILVKERYISSEKAVYAVDLEKDRLDRIQKRFPWITTIEASADTVPGIQSRSLDWILSTMVMEHVPDETKYLREISRLLKPHGKAYITTVYKRTWAWYFRKRNGESVLDTSHLREYTDMDAFSTLITNQGELDILALQLLPMWFPLLDPILFRLGRFIQLRDWMLNLLRFVKVPIPGYFEVHVILGRREVR